MKTLIENPKTKTQKGYNEKPSIVWWNGYVNKWISSISEDDEILKQHYHEYEYYGDNTSGILELCSPKGEWLRSPSLRFNKDLELIDYDGVEYLIKNDIAALRIMGFKIPKHFEN